jgi:signal transduction histidine kinase
MVGVPLAVAVALTRYRLYEIDWIVDRTLYYVTLTALLAAVWVGVAVLLGVVIGEDAWVAAVATAVAALLAGPARRRLQDAVDRRFARARYDAVRRVRAFEDAIRDGTASPDGIEDVVRLAIGDPRATLLLRLPPPDGLVDVHGTPVESPPDDLVASPVEREGDELAVLFHDPSVDRHPQLLRDVLAAATLSIELARLQMELQRQLAEVEVSRERIVRAGYAERKRLERDLHDGAQQRLVGLGIRLRRIQRSLPAGGLALEPALDEAVGDVQRAIDDLRTIARGLRPAGLDDGLAVALAELARSVPVRMEVDATAERLPGDVEAAAYYVACEAVTNAVKHASPSTIRVDARRDDGVVRLVIADDGVGGARPTAGHGLAGLADRVGAHGGELHVESPPGAGTRVEVVIPCGD